MAANDLTRHVSSETILGAAQLQEIDERHFLAQQIFFRRQTRGWSQDDMARVAGLTQVQVGILEAGQADPTLRTLAKLATAFSCSVANLFEDPESANVSGVAEPEQQRRRTST